MTIQSIIFNKQFWSKKTSRDWLKSKSYNITLGPHIYNFDSPNYWRWRQRQPTLFNKFYVKENPTEKGIKYIIGLNYK